MTAPVEEPDGCHSDYHDLGVHAPNHEETPDGNRT